LLVSLQREQGETEKAACIDRLAVRRCVAAQLWPKWTDPEDSI
jgi:hypothetical protein